MLLVLFLYISKCFAYNFDRFLHPNLRLAIENDVQIQKVPYIVRLSTKKHSCTGTILDPSWVLTSAHCLQNEDELKITAGIDQAVNKTGQELKIKSVNRHTKYAANSIGGYDLALIEVWPLNITETVRPVELDSERWPQDDEMYNRSCIAAGWGSPIEIDIYSQTLKMFNVSARHGVRGCRCWKQFVNKRLVCLTAKSPLGFCHGDAGGPLICNNKLVGVMQFGFTPDTCTIDLYDERDMDCKKNTGSFMYLCPFLDWINSYVPTTPSSPVNCRGSKLSYGFIIIIVIFTNKHV